MLGEGTEIGAHIIDDVAHTIIVIENRSTT